MKTTSVDLPRAAESRNKFFRINKDGKSVRIERKGYIIREMNYADCDSLAENANNDKIWNNLMDNFPHPYTREDAFNYISMVRAMPGKPMRFTIEMDGKAVGSIGFGSEGDVERITAEIGYWLGEKYWGQGIMPRAVRDVTEYAFKNFHYEKLYALVFSYNPGSMHVLEKAGYQLEAVLHKAAIKNEKLIDFYYFSALKDEWR